MSKLAKQKREDYGFRDWLMKARYDSELTLEGLSQEASASVPYIKQLERGDCIPSWGMAHKLAAALGYEIRFERKRNGKA